MGVQKKIEQQYKDNRKYKKNRNGKRRIGLACVPRERRIAIARLGGIAVTCDKEAVRQRARKSGYLQLRLYGLEHFARLGRKGGKIGGVRSGITRRAKRDARIKLEREREEQRRRELEQEQQQQQQKQEAVYHIKNQDEGTEQPPP